MKRLELETLPGHGDSLNSQCRCQICLGCQYRVNIQQLYYISLYLEYELGISPNIIFEIYFPIYIKATLTQEPRVGKGITLAQCL